MVGAAYERRLLTVDLDRHFCAADGAVDVIQSLLQIEEFDADRAAVEEREGLVSPREISAA